MFDWAEYLTLAEDLRAGRTPTAAVEALQRAAVSRAYYAAFCPARDYLIDTGALSFVRREEPRLHEKVAETFKLSTSGTRREIGTWLREMREARNRCDYEADNPRLAEDLRSTLIKSRWTLDHLAKLRTR